MVILESGSHRVVLGFGDVDVSPALLREDEVIGALCFFDANEATPIGTKIEHEPNLVKELNETPVRIEFHNVESIDVVIRQLEQVKKMMLMKNTDVGETSK